MEELSFSDKSNKPGIDAQAGDYLFEYKKNLHNIRGFQSALVILARSISDKPNKKGILILDDSKISHTRLRAEWTGLSRIFHPDIYNRLGLIVYQKNNLEYGFGISQEITSPLAAQVVSTLKDKGKTKSKNKTDAHFEILRVLLVHWFRKMGPIPLKNISACTGYSYPTIAKSLSRLNDQLYRHSNRSVEINSFPYEEWYKVVSGASDKRNSKGFTANRPRAVEQLLFRYKEAASEKDALGGVAAVRYYMPHINMLGTPRLDISMHSWSESREQNLLAKLDPALRETKKGELPQIIIHQLNREVSLYSRGNEHNYSDEVDSLLDLYDARLESQGRDFLDFLINQARS